MRLFPLLAAALLTLAGQPARADIIAPKSTPDRMTAPDAPTSLYVELVLNARPTGALIALEKDQDRLWVDAKVLSDHGVAVPPGAARVDVAHAAGFQARYDAPGQRLMIDVPPDLLPIRHISGDSRAMAQTSIDPGALINYDLFVQRSGGRTVAALWSEQRLFGPLGTLSNTGVVRAGALGGNGYIRFDTRFRHVDERHALTITAGDLITQALPWTTAVRMGGIQVARSYRVRPDLITAPLPSFAGQSSVPSGVDLFINGYRQSQTQVAPGRFVLDSVPVVDGAGQARIVTTDAVGRQIATVIPFYVASDLLRPGLTDFSVEAGFLRGGYGLSSFGYRRLSASASARHGVTAKLTIEAHGEASGGMASGGVGAVFAPGLLGSVRAAVAVSRRDGVTGHQLTVGYSYASPRFSIGADHIERSAGFADLGGFDLAKWRGSVRSDRVSVSTTLAGHGSLGLAYIDNRARDGSRARLGSASVSMPINTHASAFAAVDYDVRRRTVSAQLRLIVTLGTHATASGGVSRAAGGPTRLQGSIGHAVPTEGGIGYALDAAVDSAGRTLGQANATWRGAAQQIELGVAHAPSGGTVNGGVTGSIALLGGQVFRANSLPDAFALVSTGMPNVAVYYENQKIGRTGARGALFVPRVTAYHAGRFAIDALDLPIAARIEHVEARASLREGSGAIIRMPVVLARDATVKLVDAGGRPLRAGGVAKLSTGARAVIGWDGILLIEDIAGPVDIVATGGGIPACTAHIVPPRDIGALIDLGTVPCT